MVERTASFRSCSVHRPQRTRPQSPPAAASSAEPSPLGPFPQRIPGSWERSQHLFLGSSQAQGWLVSKSRSLTPHHPLGTSRSVRLIPFACRGRADMRKRAGGRLRESDIGAPGNSPQLRGRHDSARQGTLPRCLGSTPVRRDTLVDDSMRRPSDVRPIFKCPVLAILKCPLLGRYGAAYRIPRRKAIDRATACWLPVDDGPVTAPARRVGSRRRGPAQAKALARRSGGSAPRTPRGFPQA